MRQIILNKPGEFELVNTDREVDPESNEVQVKVHRIGICGTDVHAFAGEQPFFSYPRVLGHELGVEVVKTGPDVSGLSVGDRCTVEPYKIPNPDDQAVRMGKPNCAEHISVFGVHEDGGMRDYFNIKPRYLHRSNALSYDQLALVEPLGIGCHAVNRAEVQSTDRVLVIGAGPIGLAALQFAQVSGADLSVLEIEKERLQFAQKSLNIDNGVLASDDDTEEKIRTCFRGDLPNIVFDATGNAHSMKQAFSYVAHGGKLVYIGLFQGDISFHDPYFHKKELTLMGSRNALSADFKQIIRQIEEGKIDTNSWITHRAGFEEMINVFEEWTKPESKVIKAMVEL